MIEEFKKAHEAMRLATEAIRDCQYKLSHFELLDGRQALVPVEWHSRDETPPDGFVWASDGDGVWLINARGEPIGPHATAVKFWTAALVPLPPNRAKAIDATVIEMK